MTPDNDNNGETSHRRIVISAVILAAVVIGALWFTLLSPINKKASPSTSPLATTTPVQSTQPTSSPFVVSFQSPAPTLLVENTISPTPTSSPINPTSKTGPEDWVIPAAIMAIVLSIAIYLPLQRKS